MARYVVILWSKMREAPPRARSGNSDAHETASRGGGRLVTVHVFR